MAAATPKDTPAWISELPADMSSDDLAAAMRTVHARQSALTPEVSQLNLIAYALQYEVFKRFDLPQQGGQPVAYPSEWVETYTEWPPDPGED